MPRKKTVANALSKPKDGLRPERPGPAPRDPQRLPAGAQHDTVANARLNPKGKTRPQRPAMHEPTSSVVVPGASDTVASGRVNPDQPARPERPGPLDDDLHARSAGAQSVTETVALIRGLHRQRRFAMKVQQKLDRSLESYLRINATDWSPDQDEETRAKKNAEVKALIKRIRNGEDHQFAGDVAMCDMARKPTDEKRAAAEKAMERAAKELPVYPWVESIKGAGALGLATIVAETGDLSLYASPAKVWKRLGYAPYDGYAGSTWRRPTWRPRALTSEEWIENPFKPERYALMTQIALWLVNTQWIGAAKSDNGEGRPNGFYGEVYAKRRAHAAQAHPDWTPAHLRSDGLRITMKRFLRDLWVEWNKR